MGILGAYLWYRSGKKKAAKRARRAINDLQGELDEANAICSNCGHTAAQHSDEGYCPRYG